jgi:AraC-like DNA-binding protein
MPQDHDDDCIGNKEKGLFRALLSADANSLRDSFEALDRYPHTSCVTKNIKREVFAAKIEIQPTEGKGYWNFFRINKDLFVIVSNYTYLDPRVEQIAGEGLLEFHVKLSGNLNILTGRTDSIEVDGPSLLMWNQPEGVDTTEWLDSNREEKSVTIYCTPSYVSENLITNPENISSHLSDLMLKRSRVINYCHLPITPEILKIASRIVNSQERFEGLLWLTYVEAKAHELLCVILAEFEKLSTRTGFTYSKVELEKFRNIKQMVGSCFQPSPTIKQLAREAGINENKLKSGYKAIYGMTIFEYRHRCRMQQAAEMLIDGNHQMSDIAENVGYQHQSTFATAFKSYFGISPKDYKKLNSI